MLALACPDSKPLTLSCIVYCCTCKRVHRHFTWWCIHWHPNVQNYRAVQWSAAASCSNIKSGQCAENSKDSTQMTICCIEMFAIHKHSTFRCWNVPEGIIGNELFKRISACVCIIMGHESNSHRTQRPWNGCCDGFLTQIHSSHRAPEARREGNQDETFSCDVRWVTMRRNMQNTEWATVAVGRCLPLSTYHLFQQFYDVMYTTTLQSIKSLCKPHACCVETISLRSKFFCLYINLNPAQSQVWPVSILLLFKLIPCARTKPKGAVSVPQQLSKQTSNRKKVLTMQRGERQEE